jgi:thioredoxin 1
MAGKNVQEFNELNFDQEVLKSDVPVLVDFSATWCGPCKAIAPIVGEVADKYAGQVKVGVIDIDESPGIAQRFGIRGVPTLYVFKSGEVLDRLVGAGGPVKQKLTDMVERAL